MGIKSGEIKAGDMITCIKHNSYIRPNRYTIGRQYRVNFADQTSVEVADNAGTIYHWSYSYPGDEVGMDCFEVEQPIYNNYLE